MREIQGKGMTRIFQMNSTVDNLVIGYYADEENHTFKVLLQLHTDHCTLDFYLPFYFLFEELLLRAKVTLISKSFDASISVNSEMRTSLQNRLHENAISKKI